jgi:hypothetical protein
VKEMITRACGHAERVNLMGASRDRDQKREWLRTSPCAECYRQREAEAAAKTAEASGLPALTGTEKQVAWALTVRSEKLADCEKGLGDWRRQIDRARESGDPRATPENLARAERQYAASQEVLEQLRAETRASVWIEARDTTWSRLINERLPVGIRQ